jgi:uncharacterized membrane protein
VTEDGRNETALERLDRNWTDLLQELRVLLVGVQLLTGFLLVLPFQTKFATLSTGEHVIYLSTVASCIIATALLQAPVSVHRALFRRHQRAQTVLIAHRLSIAGIFFLACAIIGVSFLIFAVVETTAGGIAAAAVVTGLLGTLWLVLPRVLRRREGSDGAEG